jgi:hypothetical protein
MKGYHSSHQVLPLS